MSHAVAEFTAAESFLDQQKSRQFVPSQRYRGNDNHGLESPDPSCKLQCRSSNANSLGWRVRGGPTESYQGISNTWLVYGFVSSRPLSPARQCGLCDEITLASLQGAPPKRCPRAGQRPCRAYKRLRRLWSYTAAFPRLSYSIKTRLSSQSHMSDRSPHLCV